MPSLTIHAPEHCIRLQVREFAPKQRHYLSKCSCGWTAPRVFDGRHGRHRAMKLFAAHVEAQLQDKAAA
jgi:hypothetical protein